MYVVEGRNVNTIYAELVRLIRTEGVYSESRAGEVLALPAPVMLVTHRPQERVLLDERRDANPFFHLFESLFLLAGRDDYTWLDRFVSNFSARFAEPNGRGHGSYGRRWRSHFGFDQLDVVVEKLRRDPTDRRVVISIWDPTAKHGIMEETEGVGIFADSDVGYHVAGADDLRGSFADQPCNTHIYPRVVNGCLDLTVCCRSNDAIWGATGANAVQFSMLQEYLAGRIGVGVGRLYQLANNMHIYTARAGRYGDPAARRYWPDAYDDPEPLRPVPIMTDPEHWDEDLRMFMRIVDGDPSLGTEGSYTYHNRWFLDVAFVMWATHHHYALGDKKHALALAEQILAPDWRGACENWIRRRMR